MTKSTKAALTLAAVLGLTALGARTVEAEGYYVASICNPANPLATTDGASFSEGANFVNASTTQNTRARCGLPNDDALGNITFEFMVKRSSTGTTSCSGYARGSDGSLVWASNSTSHSSNNSGVYSILSTNNGPAGTDQYTYSTHCSLAQHRLERLRLY
jgi:hypothetical protein